MANGKITANNINEYWDELNDYIRSKSEGNSEEGAGKDQGEGLHSYTETELAAREREQKQRDKQQAELKARQREQADREIDTVADDLKCLISGNDLKKVIPYVIP
jgi:hypothetical protein